jgi:hypothetical protein
MELPVPKALLDAAKRGDEADGTVVKPAARSSAKSAQRRRPRPGGASKKRSTRGE